MNGQQTNQTSSYQSPSSPPTSVTNSQAVWWNFDKIIRTSFRFYSKNFLKLISFTMITYGIGWLITFFIGRSLSEESLLSAILSLIKGILYLWGMATIIMFLGNAEKNLSIKEYLFLGFPKTWETFWLQILLGIIIGIGTILLIIPGIIFAIWYNFSYFTCLLENRGVIKSLGESKKLVKGYGFSVFLRLFVLGLITLALLILFYFILPKNLNILDLIFAIFLQPFVLIYFYLIYKNLREIKPVV
ncbi:MAG: hypothetical protein ACD_12C00540G0002 [uncultured bacterium]|nr:MAG: hypothetical protein ACD_12C00540G0002 [uncultured bacterium]